MSDVQDVREPGGMSWLRRYIWASLSFSGLTGLGLVAIDLFRTDFGVVNTILLAAALTAAAVQRIRFLGYTANAVAFEARRPTEQILTSACAVVLAAHAARYTTWPEVWALLPAVVGGAGVISAPRAVRSRLAYGLVLATAATVALALHWRRIPGVEILPAVGVSVLVVAVFVVIDLLTVRFWDLVLELDHARALAGELATARERLRFSADLHDIQGHSLQAIILKGQLTERLIGKDDQAARIHAAELTELARAALADTRKVAHSYRRVGLRTEVANAVELMQAAGIEVEVRGEVAAIAPPLQQPFGALVREGTTNVLRHSRATRCVLSIEVSGGTSVVRLGNDGVRHVPDTVSDGSGVLGLRERFGTIGGEVTAAQTGHDWFELTGRAREPGSERR
ncbi:two-component system, NarL family, sensor histidine kinase DesK [Amycolatopsis marina]|uniref:Two-component system, NarL family, sensor histidine kinase DesK n=1 Tax=Amycolatopsis marina TaxID=490629 RepID=A0A1I1BBW3_9PSEU|nr:histidine kinase [Amycolatopsis marina]SFB47854.1 two-component system, NarL family, sensor histidine kinase DesK [Amycolatopsis marina]